MFDSICIRRQDLPASSQPLDIAVLAEALVFYQDVHLVVDIPILQQLLVPPGPGARMLLTLIEEGFLRVSYVEKFTLIGNSPGGVTGMQYLPMTGWHTNRDWRLDKVAPEIFTRLSGGPGYGRRYGRHFAELVPTIDLNDELLAQVREDFQDDAFVEAAAEEVFRTLAPRYRLPQDYRFRIFVDGPRFAVDTNVDFEQFSAAMRSTDVWTPSQVLVNLLDARQDLFYAAHTNGELATQPLNRAIIGLKWEAILKSWTKSQGDIEAFQLMVANNAREIGESVKMGYRSWDELLDLLCQAKKWKAWLAGKDASSSLLYEYNRAVAKDTWAKAHPMKDIRFLVFTALGLMVPPAVGVALSGADTYLIDRAIGGWKPNEFVDGPLKKEFLRVD